MGQVLMVLENDVGNGKSDFFGSHTSYNFF